MLKLNLKNYESQILIYSSASIIPLSEIWIIASDSGRQGES